jgi:Ni,Fe-hydrogenase maturation factor
MAPTKPVILVSGNPLVPEDSIALRIMARLKKRFPNAEFREFDSAENLEDAGRDLIIVDAAKGIRHVTLLEGVENLEQNKVYSMHDFDLSVTLRILLKIKAIASVKLVAIPSDYPEEKAVKEAAAVISTLL